MALATPPAGHIVNMDAFLAFLEHVHGLLTTTYHNTPIVLMTSSQWTRPDCEAIALYIFEKTRTPALCMINSALATQYGLKWPHMTVIDIGFEKVDVTCIYDSRIVNHLDVGYYPGGEPSADDDDRAISGGEVFTQRLRKLLRDKNFTYEMAEQLKKSNICEVLPYAPEFPQLMDLPEDDASAATAAAVAASASASASNAAAAVIAAASGNDEPSAAGPVVASSATAPVAAAVADGMDEDDGALPVAEDGVLDVASIVTSGQTKEFLAKKDKERSERGRFGRRGKDKEAEAAAARPIRLPNAKRARTMFHFEELVEDEETVPEPTSNKNSSSSTNGASGGANGKSQGEEGEGSEEGSDAEDEEMEDGDEEDAEGGDDAEGASKSTENAAAGEPTTAAADAEKPKDESASAAESTAVKAEDKPSAAPAAPEADKTEPAEKPAEEDPPKEPEAAAASSDAAPAPTTTTEDKPATEDATMEDAPATKEEETTDTTDATKAADAPAAEASAAPASTELVLAGSSAAAAAPAAAPAPAPVEAAVVAVEESKGPRYKRLRRDFEIGLERFTFADRYEIDRIVTTIYRAVQGIEEMYMRPACWENLVFVGNGCRLRGLRENILQTLTARHLISPSSATMFTSELPSNMGTPSGTGAQTPTGSFGTPPHQLPTSSSVNPLLQAATTASLTGNVPPGSSSAVGGPGSVAGGDGHSHHFHSQTPTTIKLATLPTYLGEWTKNGFEEAMFLGAQVAARLAFCVHNLDAAGQESQRQMSLTRVDYK